MEVQELIIIKFGGEESKKDNIFICLYMIYQTSQNASTTIAYGATYINIFSFQLDHGQIFSVEVKNVPAFLKILFDLCRNY